MSKLGISTGTIPNDGTGDTLLVGAVKINSNFDEIYSTFGDGTNLTSIGGTWAANSVGVHTLRNVGIGTTNPRFALEVGAVGASGTSLYVNGNARVTGILTVGSSSITLNGSTNILNVGTGVTIYGNSGIVSAKDFFSEGVRVGVITAETIIYEGSTLYNTWQRTDVGIHTLSNVGVGTTNPISALTVQSTGSASDGELDAHPFAIKQGTSDRTLWMGYDTNIGGVGFEGAYINAASSGISRPIYLSTRNANQTPFVGIGTDRPTGTDGQMLQVTGGAYISGNLGINSVNPTSALTVQGDVSVSGVSTFEGNVNFTQSASFKDNDTLNFGTSNDLRIYHDGTTNIITNQTSANLEINLGSNSNSILSIKNQTETLARFYRDALVDGKVELYYDDSKKFETTGAGVTVTGTTFTNQLSVSGISTFSGSVGIGTTNATEKLTVRDGDISVGIDTSTGLILTSPNGTRYRLIVADNGTLSTVSV